LGSVVEQRRQAHADVDHIDSGAANAFAKRGGKSGSRKPAIAADGNHPLTYGKRLAADRLTDVAHDLVGQGLPDHAANVVSLEYEGREIHRWHLRFPCYRCSLSLTSGVTEAA